MSNVLFQELEEVIDVLHEVKKERGRRDQYLISIPKAVPFVAAAAPHGEPSFDGLVRHYGQTQNKFIKAHHFLGPLSRYACFRHACLPHSVGP